MPDLPTGTVTFLFTDIEGSTRLLQRAGEAYPALLAMHHRLLREAIGAGGGVEVQTDGDAFFAAFPTAAGALRAAVDAQRALSAHAWPDDQPVRVRMGVHSGEGLLGGDNYIGLDVHRAARIAAAGHGGQVLLSDATRALVEHAVPADTRLRDLGQHRLKDIDRPEHLHQLLIEGLPGEFPPIRTLDARLTNLRPERTSFVGRERALEQVAALLDRVRLLTLTGPGGIGKTRLALRIAADQLARFDDGVWFADLSPITDASLVPAAIAGALLVREQPGRDPVDVLVDHLRERELLLVLDNLEQVVEAAIAVGRLLDAAPGLRVLATSRVPLHLAGEREFQVPPLVLPDPVSADLDSLGGSEAVTLFLQRAATVRPGFRLTTGNSRTIAQITTQLDGLPLAIELAASRAKVLEPDEILGRLGNRLSLLTGGARDLPARQQTLRAAIEWSHDLLNPDAQRLFARLAVFSGGWTLDAAEEVCAAGLATPVLDVVGALIDHSLVRRVEVETGTSRFGMLETIRDYASERLATSGDRDVVRRRHAEYVRALAEESEPAAGEPDASSIRRVEVERDNVRAALAWALEIGGAEIGLRTAAAIWTFWRPRDLAEGRSWLERLLGLPRAEGRDAVRARALTALGSIEVWQNDYAAARTCLEEAAAIGRELADHRVLASALISLEVLVRASGDLDQAMALAREGLASADEAGDRLLAAELRGRLGLIDIFSGDPAAALEPLRAALAVQRQANAESQVALTLAALGTAERLVGDLAAAADHTREALAISLDADNMVMVGTALFNFAFIASSEGRHDRAARLVGASARIRDDTGGGPLPELLRQLGDPEGTARRALGDEAFERAKAEGFAKATEEAVSYAIGNRD